MLLKHIGRQALLNSGSASPLNPSAQPSKTWAMPDSGGRLESSVGIPILKKEAILHINTFFFPEVLLGENYKTFTVQCLQSQFVVN